MATEDERYVPLLEKIEACFSQDGRGVSLIFRNVDGSSFETGLTGDRLNNFVGVVLNVLRDLGARAKPNNLQDKSFLFTPVQAAQVELAHSPIPTDTILSVQIGSATISFSIETTKLRRICEFLATKPDPTQPPTVN